MRGAEAFIQAGTGSGSFSGCHPCATVRVGVAKARENTCLEAFHAPGGARDPMIMALQMQNAVHGKMSVMCFAADPAFAGLSAYHGSADRDIAFKRTSAAIDKSQHVRRVIAAPKLAIESARFARIDDPQRDTRFAAERGARPFAQLGARGQRGRSGAILNRERELRCPALLATWCAAHRRSRYAAPAGGARRRSTGNG